MFISTMIYQTLLEYKSLISARMLLEMKNIIMDIKRK